MNRDEKIKRRRSARTYEDLAKGIQGLKIALVVLASAAVFVSIMLFKEKGVNERAMDSIESLERSAMDAQDSLFNVQEELTRFRLTLEHLREVNPSSAKEFEQFMQEKK